MQKICSIFASKFYNCFAMKKYIGFILMSFLAFAFVACSDSDGYNADSAVSLYEPTPGRKVAQVKTYDTVDGRDYTWEHNFSYDVHGRVKEINSTVATFLKIKNQNDEYIYKRYIITSKANYYFDQEKLSVQYSVSSVCPEDSYYNGAFDDRGKRYGVFGNNGKLASFFSLDFEYSAALLLKAYEDGGRMYIPQRDASAGVNGYRSFGQAEHGDTLIADCSNEVVYGSLRNKTNFDIAGYLGLWGVELGVYELNYGVENPYQLSSLGLVGVPASVLPLKMLARGKDGKPLKDGSGANLYLDCGVELDAKDCPVSFVDGRGRRTEIKYAD